MTVSPYSSAPQPYPPPPGGPAAGRPGGPPGPDGPPPGPRAGEAPRVQVVRSPRRRKTVSARWSAGVLRVSIPASMSAADEAHWVDEMLKRATRRHFADQVDLAERAASLAARFGLRAPAEIRWVDNQQYRWGSCTPGQGRVRISSHLAKEPGWVLDYVIVHELAHLHVSAHNRAFWALVARYPLAERARGFLMARGMEPVGTPGAEDTDRPTAAQPPQAPARGWRRRGRPSGPMTAEGRLFVP